MLPTSLGQWTETCDGALKDIDVDLSSIAGRTVQFVLAVVANGSATQDQALWVSSTGGNSLINGERPTIVGRFSYRLYSAFHMRKALSE